VVGLRVGMLGERDEKLFSVVLLLFRYLVCIESFVSLGSMIHIDQIGELLCWILCVW
jgi:hypothetical protein